MTVQKQAFELGALDAALRTLGDRKLGLPCRLQAARALTQLARQRDAATEVFKAGIFPVLLETLSAASEDPVGTSVLCHFVTQLQVSLQARVRR